MALPLPKIFEAIFYGLHLHEPRLYVIVPMAILAVAILATYIPARRAKRLGFVRDNNSSDYFLMSLLWIESSSTSKIRVALGPI